MQEIAENLYLRAADVSFYGAHIQTRMTVAKLEDGRLWVHSPLILDEETREELDALGQVDYVVAPNKIHNQGLASFAEAYPYARIYASPGLPERRPDIQFHAVLGDAPEADWSEELDQACTGGNVFFSEVVFLHRATRTLIVADLVETISEETLSKANQLVAKAFGVFKRAMPSPEFRMYTADPDVARITFDRILNWDFDKIVLSHGDLVTEDAKETLRHVVDFLLHEVSTRPHWRQAFYNSMAERQ